MNNSYVLQMLWIGKGQRYHISHSLVKSWMGCITQQNWLLSKLLEICNVSKFMVNSVQFGKIHGGAHHNTEVIVPTEVPGTGMAHDFALGARINDVCLKRIETHRSGWKSQVYKELIGQLEHSTSVVILVNQCLGNGA